MLFDERTAGTELLERIEARVLLPSGVKPAAAAEAVLCALAQRLSADDAMALFAAMPATVRQFLRRCVRHGGETETFDLAEFERRVAAHLGIAVRDAGVVSRAVFAALQGLIPSRDVELVSRELPTDLRALWRAAATPVH